MSKNDVRSLKRFLPGGIFHHMPTFMHRPRFNPASSGLPPSTSSTSSHQPHDSWFRVCWFGKNLPSFKLLILNKANLTGPTPVAPVPLPTATSFAWSQLRGTSEICLFGGDALSLGLVVVKAKDRVQLRVNVDHHGRATWKETTNATLRGLCSASMSNLKMRIWRLEVFGAHSGDSYGMVKHWDSWVQVRLRWIMVTWAPHSQRSSAMSLVEVLFYPPSLHHNTQHSALPGLTASPISIGYAFFRFTGRCQSYLYVEIPTLRQVSCAEVLEPTTTAFLPRLVWLESKQVLHGVFFFNTFSLEGHFVAMETITRTEIFWVMIFKVWQKSVY